MGDGRIPPAAGDGFGQGADAYERARPSYPAEAVSCIVGRAGLGPDRRVLDLAAGTGKLTRLLVPSGAVEEIPLGDASVDVVTVAQAFHWFDPTGALAEIHRVLRPGGTLVLTWNTRDRSVDWVRAFGDAIDTGGERPYDSYYDVDYPAVVAGQGGGRFEPVEQFSCEWDQPFTPELLVARAASVSVVAALPEAERAEVLGRVVELAATHPDLAGRLAFPFPYTTRVFWCRRP